MLNYYHVAARLDCHQSQTMSHSNQLPVGRNVHVSTGLIRDCMAMFDFKRGDCQLVDMCIFSQDFNEVNYNVHIVGNRKNQVFHALN